MSLDKSPQAPSLQQPVVALEPSADLVPEPWDSDARHERQVARGQPSPTSRLRCYAEEPS